MKRIVWLSSYPKSGNTWMRFWLANYLQPRAGGIPVDQLSFGHVASLRRVFDEWSGLESSELTDEEVETARADTFRAIAAHSRSNVFLKVHDAWHCDHWGAPIFPPDVTRVVLYIVRHPYDVAVSLSHHLGVPPSTAVEYMCDDTFELATGGEAGLQFPQRVMSWGRHVLTWLDGGLSPVVLVRYEDMRRRPMQELSRVLEALGEPVDDVRLAAAVEYSSFQRLQQQERERGFPGRGAASGPFFRHGREGAGLTILSAAQRAQLHDRHDAVMARLGYGAGGDV